MSLALKLVLSPLLVAQAVATRRRALVLPEAEGPRSGRLGSGDGSALRVLIAGDSSAAGVGVTHQRHAVAGHIASTLQRRLQRPVEWVLRARTGLTTREVHEMLRDEAPSPADVAVIVSGVNDVIDQIPAARALQHRVELADWLLERRLARHVLFAPLPPIGRFPLLPQPLRRMMGADATRHDRALAVWAAGRNNVSHIAIDLELTADVMAEDGFHPGEPVYRICGEALALHIATTVWPQLDDEGRRAARQ